MHFALHYGESIDNTTWLFRFKQAKGEFVSLNNPGRQVPKVVMRAFIVERAADLFLAKPAHAHNEHELELLASAVKSRQPTRRAADLIFRPRWQRVAGFAGSCCVLGSRWRLRMRPSLLAGGRTSPC
ncbi:hypothetical protein BCR44DRAFT_1438106 [Catenaria anguillulae PL171]|uniref:Uncharacterized protein n=1 Tax=Catenaria anguillulae PL171 TaxID=765915 RepID=A0A1Y2HG40_9FUNG|nr:hypothetical protein BCR44DRAFT_1438106 [Catenaria anguillulae PL171]